MAKRTFLPFAASLQDEAAAWVTRRDNGALNKKDAQEFDAWVASSPVHEAAYRQFDSLWSELGEVAEELTGDQQKGPQHQGSPYLVAANDRFGFAKRFAAVAIIVACVGAVTMNNFDWSKDASRPSPIIAQAEQPSLAERAIETEVGEQRVVTMEDGSRITLNTATKLSTQFATNQRIVKLDKGEAYFEVAHDPDRPFIVQSPLGSVRAVGTKFIVRLDGKGHLSVIVSEGKVLVSQGAAQLIDPKVFAEATPLIAGQEIEITGANALPIGTIAPEEMGQELAWRQGDIVFDGETLESAAAELQRYTKRKLIVDPRVANYSVGGYFRTNDLDAFVDTVESVFPVKAVKTANELRFVPAS